ncbi:I78 family peptidase inhibitor [Algicella marina]|uniref:Peptidase inhibitor I78 family protein n=1 Tax=Algicella marina TaxID=2683284 RepID=A0A6P1T5R3_9RHOB|nr:I78 family peptidase inhibitor [Algicella marina]QHQ36796.1 hypothetical protein GO499_17230 [Algicella marina]
MGRIIPFVLTALVMVSCSKSEEVEAPEPVNECGALEAQELVGKTVEDLAAMTFAAEVTRFINPGDVITQDFRPERMNIVFDEDGAITRVYCG